jgi:hypothetical protein
VSTTHQLPPEPLQSEGSGRVPPEAPGAGSKRPWLYVVIGILVVALIGAGLVAYQQHRQVTDRQEALAAAVSRGNQATAEAAALAKRTRQLKAALAKSANASRGQVTALQKQLAAVQGRIATMLGPALADGKYFGALYAVGATQDPPRLVIDLEQFFRGAAADKAAKEDGALPPGETHVPNDVYIRNTDPQWRILKIDPSTKVTLTTSPFGTLDKPAVVTLGRFGNIWNNDAGHITGFPFWITVKGNTVVAIAEQYMP